MPAIPRLPARNDCRFCFGLRRGWRGPTSRHASSPDSAVALATVPAVAIAQTPRQAVHVPSPKQHLGFAVGADRTLADWGQITGYFQRLATVSRAVHVDTLGPTTNGQPFIVAAISTPANIARLPAFRAAQARLADPRRLTPDEERRLVASQPSVVFISNNIHGSEIGGSQMAMELAYRLATNDTLQRYLEKEIVLIAPSMNPDGQRMITEWYRKNLGTKWEGGPLPWLYHPVRRSRQQPRLVHGDAEGDASRDRLSLRRVVPGDLLRRASNGRRGRADLRAAARGSGEPESRPDHRAGASRTSGRRWRSRSRSADKPASRRASSTTSGGTAARGPRRHGTT